MFAFPRRQVWVGWPAGGVVAVAALVFVATAGPSFAGVRVSPDAARAGVYGLRADVRVTCGEPGSLLVLGPVVSDESVEACGEVVVQADVQAGGRLDVHGGRGVAFGDGFAVEAGGELVAGPPSGGAASFVVDTTPQGEAELAVRWYARFDQVDLPAGGEAAVLRLRGAAGERARVVYRTAAGGGVLSVVVRQDDGSERETSPVFAGPGWHRLELAWSSGSALTATGQVSLGLDGGTPVSLESLATGAAVIENVDLGVIDASGAGGWVDCDDYAVARSGPIGPAG